MLGFFFVIFFRKAIQGGIDKYAAETFTEEKYASATYAEPNGTVTLVVSAKNLNLSNYWSGGWRSGNVCITK